MEKDWSVIPRSRRLGVLRKYLKKGYYEKDKELLRERRRRFGRRGASIMPLQGVPCYICKAPAQHRHHVIPLSRGGLSTLENLVALCIPCHNRVDGRHERQKKRKGPPQVQNPPGPYAILPVHRTARTKPALSACDKVVFVKVA